MNEVQPALLYAFTFVSLYIQVFLLLSAFRKRKEVAALTLPPEGVEWPGVTIIVPCWNEERTVVKTVESLLALDYPKDKLFIKVVDDGSKDNTWERMQVFSDHPTVELIRKPNGGKHTAMNHAIKTTTTEYVGCLDADAFAAVDALKKLMWKFLEDKDAMAVSPSVLAWEPKGLFQKAQQVEYDMSVFVKKVIGTMNGIHVTPGPFSIYRRKVFEDLGMYRKAHSAEDMEIAYRMQVNGYKIVQCHDAFVYTVTPNTLKKLYKQRVRWMYGFINNTMDYKGYLLKPKYGTFSMFTIPSGAIALFGAVIMSAFMFVSLGTLIVKFVERIMVTHIVVPSLPFITHLDPFYIDARPVALMMVVLYALLVTTVLIGQKMREKKPIPGLSIIYFIVIYMFISPVWLAKALYNTVLARDTAWR